MVCQCLNIYQLHANILGGDENLFSLQYICASTTSHMYLLDRWIYLEDPNTHPSHITHEPNAP